jgi:hypothetical protein
VYCLAPETDSGWRKLKGKAPTFHACYFVATEDIIKNRFILDKTKGYLPNVLVIILLPRFFVY